MLLGQRKTRCDPSLPRCLPCERSGSVCEYLDAAKGRKINRYYVVKLQEKVRSLEAELDQYIEEDGDYPRTNEDIVRPGGMVRLNGNDETPRYLGPSSGIAMSRLLMEQAKKYSDASRISELIPEVRARRQTRMQSVQMTNPIVNRRKSYPMMSDTPPEGLPTRAITDRLVETFNQKCKLNTSGKTLPRLTRALKLKTFGPACTKRPYRRMWNPSMRPTTKTHIETMSFAWSLP